MQKWRNKRRSLRLTCKLSLFRFYNQKCVFKFVYPNFQIMQVSLILRWSRKVYVIKRGSTLLQKNIIIIAMEKEKIG